MKVYIHKNQKGAERFIKKSFCPFFVYRKVHAELYVLFGIMDCDGDFLHPQNVYEIETGRTSFQGIGPDTFITEASLDKIHAPHA